MKMRFAMNNISVKEVHIEDVEITVEFEVEEMITIAKDHSENVCEMIKMLNTLNAKKEK